MNATAANASPSRRATGPRDATTQLRMRRRAIGATVVATFLGLYVLGVGWFAETLGDEMSRSLQIAPAVADTQHR